MNESELRQKLSILKTAPVPRGYWENFWPRLKMSLEAVIARTRQDVVAGTEQSVDRSPRSLWSLAMTSAVAGLLIGFVSYRFFAPAPYRPIDPSHLHLASANEEAKAHQVFREMLMLFPNRINWISFVEGKVDFSISSVAYQETDRLIPLLISLPREQNPLHVQALLRPGQNALVRTAWNKETQLDLTLGLSANGKSLHAGCRLSGKNANAAIEGDVSIPEGQGTLLGSLRWEDRLVQVHVVRPREEP